MRRRNTLKELMIRIRFTTADLGRLRFAISPLAQITSAATSSSPSIETASARRRQHAALTRLGSHAEPFRQLDGPGAWVFPDFVTPVPTTALATLDDELAAMIATPESRKLEDLEIWRRSPTHRRYAELLAQDPNATVRLAGALARFNRELFNDHWMPVLHALRADVSRRTLDLSNRGVDHVLSTLHPRLTWRNPDLYLDVRETEFPPVIELDGRGAVLVPSLSWSMTFGTKLNNADPLVIIYPAHPNVGVAGAVASLVSGRPLEKLMGRSRAAVLLTLVKTPGLSTGQLAAACDLSIASASEHATVLRSAGLVATTRSGSAVYHRSTYLGVRLTTGDPDA